MRTRVSKHCDSECVVRQTQIRILVTTLRVFIGDEPSAMCNRELFLSLPLLLLSQSSGKREGEKQFDSLYGLERIEAPAEPERARASNPDVCHLG